MTNYTVYQGPDSDFGQNDDYRVGDVVHTYDATQGVVTKVNTWPGHKDYSVIDADNEYQTRHYDGSRLALVRRAVPIARARELAQEWHEGQGSSLYVFASTGHISPDLWADLARESNEDDDDHAKMLNAIDSAPTLYVYDTKTKETVYRIHSHRLNHDYGGSRWLILYVEDCFDPALYMVAFDGDNYSDAEETALESFPGLVESCSLVDVPPTDYGYLATSWDTVANDDPGIGLGQVTFTDKGIPIATEAVRWITLDPARHILVGIDPNAS